MIEKGIFFDDNVKIDSAAALKASIAAILCVDADGCWHYNSKHSDQ